MPSIRGIEEITPSLSAVRKDPVGEALKFFKQTLNSNTDNSKALAIIDDKVAKRAALRLQAENMSSVERGSRKVIQEAVNKLSIEITDIRTNLGLAPSVFNYRPFPLAPLSWRDKDGMPVLAVFDVHGTGECRLTYSAANGYLTMTPTNLPPAAKRVLLEGVDQIVMRSTDRVQTAGWNNSWKTTAKTTFEGKIPDEVKAEIVTAERMFDDIFMLAESRGWSYKTEQINRDPIIVGGFGEQLWFITAFDMTPVEQLVADIMNGKQKKA